EILTPEPDPKRVPDEQIDFNAQFRTATLSQPKGLNIYTSDRDQTVATRIGFYIYEPFAERHNADKDKFKAGLCVSARRSPDKKSFLLKLRKNVYWHRPAVDMGDATHGWMRRRRPVTAHDAAFALKMILDERADTEGTRSSFNKVESYKALDDHTFLVNYKEANYYSTGKLLGDLKPLPKWIYTREEDGTAIDEASWAPRFPTHWWNQYMLGYGSFKFKEHKIGQHILLERNEKYWGRRPGYKTMLWRIRIVSDEPRYNLYRTFDPSGQRKLDQYAISSARYVNDLLSGKPSALREELESGKSYLYAYQRKMYAYTGWATRGKYFSDARTRLAMTLATNRASWKKDILHNHAIFASGPTYPLFKEYDQTIKHWPYDLKRAKKLLDAAGWKDTDGNGVRDRIVNGVKIEFRFKVLQSSSSQSAINAMQSDWRQSLRKIGVVMEPDPVVWAQLLKRLRDRDYDACTLAWFMDDDAHLRPLFHSDEAEIAGSNNHVQWSTPRGDEILDALETEFVPAKRYKLFHEFHAIFHQEQPYTLSWTWKNPVMMDSRIGGIHGRHIAPQVDIRQLWWQKDGPAIYADDRSKIIK
ncbi:MAG: ABC transporter substrate-binding protein, partial [Planctomycetota bacterium]